MEDNIPLKSNLFHFFFFQIQDDFSDLDDITGHAGQGPVTAQPQAGQGGGGQMPVFAMPAPSANPTNPFTGATESTGLTSGAQPTYTPGK